MKRFFLALAAVVTVFSCQKTPEIDFNLSSDSIAFAAAGGESSFTIDIGLDKSWNLVKSDDSDWLKCYTSAASTEDFTYSGTGPQVIRLVAERYRPLGQRSATLTLNASGESPVVINIVQDGPVVPETPPVDTVLVRSFSNAGITIPIAEGFVSSVSFPSVPWATLKSKADDSIDVSFQENATSEYRTIDVPVKAEDGSLVQTLRIIQSWKNIERGELKIAEVFYTGYPIHNLFYSDAGDGDQYVILANDTRETLYLDRVLFAVSKASSNQFITGFVPSDDTGLGVKAVYAFPGTGKDFPLAAGASVVLAVSAQNFSGVNNNLDAVERSGIDLSIADFEIFDGEPDIDQPFSDNLLPWAKETAGVFAMNDSGLESYALAVAPKEETAATFAGAHPWAAVPGTFLIPAGWVVDAVNCGVEPEKTKTDGDSTFVNTNKGLLVWSKEVKKFGEEETKVYTNFKKGTAAPDGDYLTASEMLVTVVGGVVTSVKPVVLAFDESIVSGRAVLPRGDERFGQALVRKKEGDNLKDSWNSSLDFEAGTPSLK